MSKKPRTSETEALCTIPQAAAHNAASGGALCQEKRNRLPNEQRCLISHFANTLLAATLLACFLTGCGGGQTFTSNSVDTFSPGNGQPVNLLAPGEKGEVSLKRNFYFVFDGSGSMNDPPRNGDGDKRFTSKIEGAKWAVREFMNKVPKDVNLGLYVFDQAGRREVLPLGANNRSQFLDDIANIQAGGATPLGAAIGQGSIALEKQYQKQLGYGDFRLIVITDGDATDNLDSGVREAARFRIPIYTIGFDMDSTHALRKHSISYRAATSAQEVEQALESAAGELDIFDPSNFAGK